MIKIQLDSIEGIAVDHILSKLESVKGIYLYGSRAMGKSRPDSDYDLAVLAEKRLAGSEVFFRLQLELAGLTDSGVNLVDLRAVPTVLQFEVLRGRTKLYCADKSYCADFESYIISSYQRFNEERKPIIDKFIQRRTQHGQ